MDWYFEVIRCETAEGTNNAVNYHRFADNIVIIVSGHHSKQGWAERVLQRLQEQPEPLGVEPIRENTNVVGTRQGNPLGFWGSTCVAYQSAMEMGVSS